MKNYFFIINLLNGRDAVRKRKAFENWFRH